MREIIKPYIFKVKGKGKVAHQTSSPIRTCHEINADCLVEFEKKGSRFIFLSSDSITALQKKYYE